MIKDMRKSARYPIDLGVSALVNRHWLPARIKDISILGCCLLGELGLEKGDEFTVQIGGRSIVATVAWTVAGLTGANFHREINPLQIVRDHVDHPMFTRRRLAHTMVPTTAFISEQAKLAA